MESHRPPDPRAARGRRPDVLHRPRQGDRPVHVRRAPAGQAARAARPDPGYGATVDHAEIGLPLTAFISIRPIDPSQPDDSPERLRGIPEIESCWSVAGEESYILKVRVATPADLEDLLARIRAAANVSTRTTIVLSTPYESRPVT